MAWLEESTRAQQEDTETADDDAVRALNEGSIKIEWSDYDWSLNDSSLAEQPAP